MAIKKLPADLPENWKINDAVTPNGTEIGLDEKHGFNYLMKQVNQAQTTINEVIDSDADKAPLKHSHTMEDIPGLSLDWSAIENKPTAYPPENHNHDSRYVPYGTEQKAGQFDKTDNIPTDTTSRLNYNGIFYGSKVMGAWYNDYAEVRETDAYYAAGSVLTVNDGIMTLATKRLQPLCRVVSDTYGMCIGECNEHRHSASVAVCGRVLVKLDVIPLKEHIGLPVCSGQNGTASIMTREEIREYPDRMIGVIYSIPKEETWGNDQVVVNDRIWIEVK